MMESEQWKTETRYSIVVIGAHHNYHMLRPLVESDAFKISYLANVSPTRLICSCPALICSCSEQTYEVRRLRRLFPHTPIVVYSSKKEEAFIVRMLQSGADDYINSSCGRDEWQARLRTRLRQYPAPARTFQSQDHHLSLHLATREVTVGYNRIHLTMIEHVLLYMLMRYAEETLSWAFLLQTIWGEAYLSEVDYLRVYIRQLRRKLEADPTQPRYIQTVVGVGYQFTQPCLALSIAQ